MFFLTMHGIDSDHRAGQRKRAEQSLDRWDFIGLFVAVEMRQHQSRVRGQGCSTLSIEFPVEERICSGESGSISILTEC